MFWYCDFVSWDSAPDRGKRMKYFVVKASASAVWMSSGESEREWRERAPVLSCPPGSSSTTSGITASLGSQGHPNGPYCPFEFCGTPVGF